MTKIHDKILKLKQISNSNDSVLEVESYIDALEAENEDLKNSV